MKFYTIALTLLFSFSVFSVTAQKAEADILKGLKKTDNEILQTQSVQLDGESIPIYNHKRERIRGNDLIKAFTSGDFIPEFYIDKEENIQAVVLREATLEEQNAIKAAISRRNKGSLNQGAAPVFSASALDGKSYTLDELKGKVVVLNFWFIGCKPCIQEMPDLNELVEKHKNDEVVFLGFALDSAQKLKSFLKKREFDYTIVANSNSIAKEYNVGGYPTHIVIDQNSDIAFSTTGLSSITIDQLETTIEDLLKKN